MVNLYISDQDIDNIHLAILDKDGTIMELHHYWVQMIKLRTDYIAEELSLNDKEKAGLMFAMGADTSKNRLRPEGPVGLKPRGVVLQAAADYLKTTNHFETLSVCSDAFDHIDQISSEMFPRLIRPIPGAVELLHSLHERGCKIAIATTDRTERAQLAMEYLNCADIIDSIIGADIVKMPKPNPETILKIFNKTGCDKKRTIMVGDAITDVKMGVKAQCKASVGVLTGLTHADELMQITPYVIESISKIEIKD
ncbi:MAG: HAD family hydrolase [Methanomicrobiaceae archaeon]|nr:HAD family hydrolase [Methanomicrobiaceae archaeon]